MNQNIKPCPFCGCQPVFIRPKELGAEVRDSRLQCVNIKCPMWRVSTYTSKDKGNLISVWNHRI